MPPTIHLIPATASHIPRITDIQFSAFAGDPYQESLHPNYLTDPSVRTEAIARMEREWGKDARAEWMMACGESGEMYGFAEWRVYAAARAEAEWRRPVEVDWCTGRRREIAVTFLSVNQRLRERVWAGRPHVLLSLLCVHRDFQRRGVGTALVRWGIERARELGLAVYLEASPAGYQLYRKMGFRQVDVEVVRKEEWDGDRDLEYIAMVRDPDGVGEREA